MSIDTLISDLMAGVSRLADVTEKNTAILERVVAFQEAAMAKLEGATGTTTRKPRETAAEKKARETTEAAAAVPGAAQQPAEGEHVPNVATTHTLLATRNGETQKNVKGEDEPTGNYRASDFSRAEVKNEFIGWLGSTTDLDERKARAAFVGEIGQHFGVKQPFHPTEGLADDDQRKQTLFFLRRKREGLKVDFSTDYDFDGDPLADQTVDGDGGGDDAMDSLG